MVPAEQHTKNKVSVNTDNRMEVGFKSPESKDHIYP